MDYLPAILGGSAVYGGDTISTIITIVIVCVIGFAMYMAYTIVAPMLNLVGEGAGLVKDVAKGALDKGKTAAKDFVGANKTGVKSVLKIGSTTVGALGDIANGGRIDQNLLKIGGSVGKGVVDTGKSVVKGITNLFKF